MEWDKVLQEVKAYNTHEYIPTKKEKLYRVQGSKTDRYMFTAKNNKFASPDYGKFDKSQYSDSDTNDAKEYKKRRSKGKKDKAQAYLTKVNNGYKVKI
jgi:hypothetical protein